MDVEFAKKGFIEAYKSTFGNVTEACKMVGIARQSYYNWVKADKEFEQALKDVQPDELFLDLCEQKLTEKINNGDTISIIFALKTKGKKRGYIEKVEHGYTDSEGNDVKPFTVQMDSGCKPIE